MGQPEILYVLCLGTLLEQLSVLFYLGVAAQKKPTNLDVYCSLGFWTNYIGLVLITAILLGKLYRSFKVVQFRRGQTILPRHIFAPFFVVLVLIVGILTAWQLMFPIHYESKNFHDFRDPDEAVGICRRSGEKYEAIAFEAVVDAIILLLVVGILVLAYKIRSTDEIISDSRRILQLFIFFTASQIIFFAIKYPVTKTTGIEDSTKWAVLFIAWLLFNNASTLAIIYFLFLPRLYYVWYERVHGRLPENVEIYGSGRVRVTVSSGPHTSSNHDESSTIERSAMQLSAANAATTSKGNSSNEDCEAK